MPGTLLTSGALSGDSYQRTPRESDKASKDNTLEGKEERSKEEDRILWEEKEEAKMGMKANS